MKFTLLSSMMLIVGGLLIILNFVFANVWIEGFKSNLINNHVAAWIGLGLIIIGLLIAIFNKKRKRK